MAHAAQQAPVFLGILALIVLAAAPPAWAGSGQMACTRAGPQAPRDLTQFQGANAVSFAKAPPAGKMKLCDIHFHRFAEHRASGYLKQAGKGNHKGYICNGTAPGADRGHAAAHGCHGIAAGDSIEVHWVFTTCSVKPGPTLGSCFTPACKDPQLRVEARVFSLTGAKRGQDFATFSNHKSAAVTLPKATAAVEYIGSTTGDKYNDGTCSPFKVTWNVSSTCTPLSMASINKWCGKDKNPFKEDHAHGVRRLVTAPGLLSPVK